MWSSSSDEHHHQKGLSSSRGLSSSTSSSSSRSVPFSPSTTTNHPSPRLKTMEEVWKDLNLSSLRDHHHHHHQAVNFGDKSLQNFLGQPFASTDANPTASRPFTTSPAASSPVQGRRAATMLNLNSVPELNFFGNLDPLSQNSILQPPTISQVPFKALAVNGRKRVPVETENSSGDRGNKRMIKNRESAARSRARKQAYMNELEAKVARSVEENARLKKQLQEQLHLAAAAQVRKKNSLHRTSTAPF